MNGEAIISVSAAVVALTQLAKWAGVDQKHGPLMVLFLSAIGVGMWVISQPALVTRADTFQVFAGWVAVSLSAAGVFGFTRSTVDNFTAVRTQQPAGDGGGK